MSKATKIKRKIAKKLGEPKKTEAAKKQPSETKPVKPTKKPAPKRVATAKPREKVEPIQQAKTLAPKLSTTKKTPSRKKPTGPTKKVAPEKPAASSSASPPPTPTVSTRSKGGMKSRRGKGFSIQELNAASLTLNVVRKLKVPIDHRRGTVNQQNVDALKKWLPAVAPTP